MTRKRNYRSYKMEMEKKPREGLEPSKIITTAKQPMLYQIISNFIEQVVHKITSKKEKNLLQV